MNTKKQKKWLAAAVALLLVLAAVLAVCLASCEPDAISDTSSAVSAPPVSSYPPEDESSAISSDSSDDIPSEESPPDESEYSDEEPFDPPSTNPSDTSNGSESSDEAPTPPDTSDEVSDVSDETSEIPACMHEWEEATCTSAKSCASCGVTEGSPTGHDWKEADCDTPKTCETCGITDGSSKGHSWKSATCTSAKTCEACGTTEGSAKGHSYTTTTVAPTFNAQGYDLHTCKTCGKSYKDGYTDKLSDSSSSADFAAIYNALIAFKSKYPEGTAFDNSVIYTWFYDNCSYYDAGCAAFASELSIQAFGTEAFVKITDITFADVRVGDILRINGNTHTVIVLEVHSDHVVIAEANYNGMVHWGRTLTASQVADANYLISRYADRVG